MKCPHCLENFFETKKEIPIGNDINCQWIVESCVCPSCHKHIIKLLGKLSKEEVAMKQLVSMNKLIVSITKTISCYPQSESRTALPPIIPEKYTQDFTEACNVLPYSAKASAALSRRCLQNLLRDVEDIKHGDLSKEIEQIINKQVLPSYISQSLDAVRNIGNFAAHPMKSKSTGEIIEVELGEAEWNLDVLESLFDFYFIQPSIIQEKKEHLNAKLKEAGKPEMK